MTRALALSFLIALGATLSVGALPLAAQEQIDQDMVLSLIHI